MDSTDFANAPCPTQYDACCQFYDVSAALLLLEFDWDEEPNSSSASSEGWYPVLCNWLYRIWLLLPFGSYSSWTRQSSRLRPFLSNWVHWTEFAPSHRGNHLSHLNGLNSLRTLSFLSCLRPSVEYISFVPSFHLALNTPSDLMPRIRLCTVHLVLIYRIESPYEMFLRLFAERFYDL